MKIGLISDMQLRFRAPRNRIDDFFITQYKKTATVCQIFNKEECQLVLQAGDLWDSSKPSFHIIGVYLSLLMDHKIPWYTIFGQHDLYMHSEQLIPHTPSWLLSCAKVVHLLNNTPTIVGSTGRRGSIKPTHLYGANFGQDIPILKLKSNKALNILVVHAMIGNKPLFPGQELTKPKSFLRQNPDYQLVLCGDYHYPFIETYQDRTIVNTGCLVRLTISERDLEHEPSVCIYDTDVQEIVKIIKIPIKPPKEVFNLIEPPKKPVIDKTAEVIDFVKKLSKGGKRGVSFKDNLMVYFRNNDVESDVQSVIVEELSEMLNG